MTVIAWDGTTLSADRQGTVAGYPYSVTKIHRLKDGLVGFSGSGSHAAELLAWFKRGKPEGEYPKRQSDEGAGSTFISKYGEIFMYASDSEYPELIEEKFFARGAGRDYALAVMYLGHDSKKAVEVACALDISCGKGVDALVLKE